MQKMEFGSRSPSQASDETKAPASALTALW